MINFYKDLKANHTDVANRKAQALRDAVLRMIKDPCYRHPFNWAGFVLLGSASWPRPWPEHEKDPARPLSQRVLSASVLD